MDYIKMPCNAPSFFMKTFMQLSKGIYHSISFILKNAYSFVGLIWFLIISVWVPAVYFKGRQFVYLCQLA